MVIMGKIPGTGNNSNAYRFLVGKPKGMKALGRSRYEKKKRSNFPRIRHEGIYEE